MSSNAKIAYDRVAYRGASHAQTHPDRLASVATLFGMHPKAVEECRVLEVGCTDAGNLLPMAYALPGAHFVGIDLNDRAIEAGRAAITALGLSNITLQACDILEFPANLGAFDYIIAHGVYSWVPAAVREKTLAVCRAHLAPQGI